jgi:hypothetical protein
MQTELETAVSMAAEQGPALANLRETEQILDRAYAHLKALRDELARREREARERRQEVR